MALDLAELVAPSHTAVVTSEIQRGVVGDSSALPELAAAFRDSGALANTAEIVRVARAAGVRIVHATAHHRGDRLGGNANARLFAAMKRSSVGMLPGSPATEVVSEVGVEASDIVLPRLQGLGPMAGTELDPVPHAGMAMRRIAINCSVERLMA